MPPPDESTLRVRRQRVGAALRPILGEAVLDTVLGHPPAAPDLARHWITRLVAGEALACIALTTGVVALIKSVSGIHCPVELARYGGRFHYEALIDRLLRPVVGEGRPGACFPGGHSSGGLSLLALYFVALHHHKAYAPRVLMATAAIGFVFALTQWIRGAHFPSHDLTTAAIAWAICLLLAAARRSLPMKPAVAALPEHANIVGS